MTHAADIDAARVRYLAARAEYERRQARADAAFRRYFERRHAGERTSGAAWQRLENLANYASADLEAAEGALYALDIDPESVA